MTRLGATAFPSGLGTAIGAWLLGSGLKGALVAAGVVWVAVAGTRSLHARNEAKYGRDEPYQG